MPDVRSDMVQCSFDGNWLPGRENLRDLLICNRILGQKITGNRKLSAALSVVRVSVPGELQPGGAEVAE